MSGALRRTGGVTATAYPPGRYWGIDQEGFLRNDASPERIAPAYRAAIERTVAAYRHHLGPGLHSVYLRGSVPRGMAIPGVSDLDSLALVTGDEEQAPLAWAASEEAKIVGCCTALTGVQFEAYALDDAMRWDRVSELCFVLRTQTVCVHGEDVAVTLPGYRPDVAVANIDVVQIEPDIEEALDQLRRNPDGATTRYWCRRIAKNLIRACFALTIIDDRRFTRDLGLCAEAFLAHHPGQRRNVERALHFAHRPTGEAAELSGFLADFGGWLAAQASLWLEARNPGRLSELPRCGDRGKPQS